MALIKKEIFIASSSTKSFDETMNESLAWLMTNFQGTPENNLNGNPKDLFFADVIFGDNHPSNSGKTWRLYTEATGDYYNLVSSDYGRYETLINNKNIIGIVNNHSTYISDLSLQLSDYSNDLSLQLSDINIRVSDLYQNGGGYNGPSTDGNTATVI